MNRTEIFDRVRAAYDRGRWVLMTDADGRPKEITIDLAERDDDLFGDEGPTLETARDNLRRFEADNRRRAAEYRPESFTAPSDDHGATIPAQGEYRKDGIAAPEIYEFALQDMPRYVRGVMSGNPGFDPKLKFVGIEDAPDLEAAHRADWVHVFDRVTRERRTLKRPEPDAVLRGLRDVAAELRGRPVEPPFGCAARTMTDPTVNTDFPPGSPLAPPPVGPLTSTEGLQPGDVLRVIEPFVDHDSGRVVTVDQVLSPYKVEVRSNLGWLNCERFAFVGRPDADGWIPWAGGENPVPGATIEARYESGEESRWPCCSDDLAPWFGRRPDVDCIVAFRIVDTPS